MRARNAAEENIRFKDLEPMLNKNRHQATWDSLPLRCPEQRRNAHPILQRFQIEGQDNWQDLPQLNQLGLIKSILASIPTPTQSARLTTA